MSSIEQISNEGEMETTSPPILTGQVKWFDRTKGYGFITQLDNNTDIFVHFTQVSGKSDEFRYLVAGEYVEFQDTTLDSEGEEEHKRVASNVTGIRGGRLMYQIVLEQQKETKNFQQDKEEYVTSSSSHSMDHRGAYYVSNHQYKKMYQRR